MTGPNGTGSLITVATCTLNQWALDFDGNVDRIALSCEQAKRAGATYRLGPELEVSGYGCEDHFLEADTFAHCWESLVELLVERGISDDGLLCDLGMPVLYGGVRYNCRVLCYERKLLLVRPKIALADNGNYRESRYFTAYRRNPNQPREELLLPKFVQDALGGQRTVPFGLGFVQTNDGVRLGCESCEELWTPQSTHIDLALRGVEIIGNGSGSHHELRKLDQRMELMMNATRKCGGIYLYANQRGCDGGRLYYDGGAIIVSNGQLLAQAPQFKIQDVQVITATVDLDDVRSYRASLPSFGIQAVHNPLQDHSSDIMIDCDTVHLLLMEEEERCIIKTTPTRQLQFSTPEEECCLGPACWLWDYLRRSGAAGFLLPLSGGADSSSVATIVGAMCHLVYEAAQHDPQVAADVRRVCRKENDESWLPRSPQEIASSVLHTVFMGTENSSENTTSRAKRLGEAIGSYHLTVPIDLMVQAVIRVFSLATGGKVPQFESRGGTMAEDLALQNIQARLRMVTAYLFAQLLPWVRDRTGFLLVLGSANVDEGLRGYMTKYDCSSADLNPIGAISKGDLKRMLLWASTRYEELDSVLKEIAGAPPTAELRPRSDNDNDTTAEHSQLDEDEMGMTYDELGWFGRLRKLSRCGPVSMFRKLCVVWGDQYTPREIGQKVQRFFFYYSVNRHKMVTLTPSYHAEGYSPDDNRFDLRQFLYNTKWPRQFGIINRMVEASEIGSAGSSNSSDKKEE
jgi:NAD+ synthase (glutamine-hydrolysing)